MRRPIRVVTDSVLLCGVAACQGEAGTVGPVRERLAKMLAARSRSSAKGRAAPPVGVLP